MKHWLQKIKIAFFSTIVILQLFAFLAPLQVKAQLIPDVIKIDTKTKTPEELPVYNGGVDKSIQDYLCTPNGKGTDLFDCVDRLYRFGVSFGAIAIVFFIVYAGYLYITGGEALKTKAKQTIYSALTGMAILLGSYVLLSFINPNLVQIKTIQPPIFNAIDLPSCEEIGFAEKCIITAGGSAGQVSTPTTGGSGPGSGKCEEVQGSGVSCKAGCVRADQVKCVHTWDSLISQAASSSGFEEAFIRATIQIESQWIPNRTSPVGAKGLMQLMPAASKDAGCSGKDLFDPTVNIPCGANYWKILKTRYLAKFGAEVQNSVRALGSAYNGGFTASKFSKSTCSDRFNFECPFTDSSKKVCKTLNKENVNYGVTLEEFYNQYKSGKCK